MDRKMKVNDSAAEDASANQANSKEEALEKLRRMEWKRNTQDTWHLARSSSRGNDIQERKKYNKEEDNYFQGTGVQKTKKLRKPKLSEGSSSVPPGFSKSEASPAPLVNAWTQKKGSALFQRENEVDDEEDQLLKLVLQESLKSAEEDKKRRMERYKMTNLDLPTSTQTLCAEKDWQEEYKGEHFNAKPNPVGFQEDSPEGDLHFVETDFKEESPTVNQRHRSIPPRGRKTSPQQKASFPENKNVDFLESENKVTYCAGNKNICYNTEKSPGVTEYDPNDNNFVEPSRPQAKYSNSSTKQESSLKHAQRNSDKLSTTPNSTLTFGDTQGIFEKIQGEYKQTNVPQNFQNEIPTYLGKASDTNTQIMPANPNEPSETDIFLHSFIRHDPPSSLHSSEYSNVSEMSAIGQNESNDLFTLPTSETYLSQNFNSAQCYITQQKGDSEQHPVTNGLVEDALSGGVQTNGRDSSSSMSGSPLPTITPYGSLENEIPASVRAAMQATPQIGSVPYPYHYSVVENNQEALSHQLQAIQLINQNMHPGIISSVPAQIRGVVPVNPHVGQPQFRIPNPNMVVSSFQGQTVSPLLQHQLQQAQQQQMQVAHMLNLNAMRLQQPHLATGIVESDGNAIKEQENMNNPSQQIMPSQAQVLAQNQQHVLQFQNHPQIMMMQNQPQTNRLVETASPKQEELLQQHTLQGMRPQTAGKTKEELQIEYQNAILALKRVQEEMQEQAVAAAQVQSPVSLPQPQPWGVIPTSPAMHMAVNQFYPMQMIPQVHPHMIQQSQNPTIISPTVQNVPQTLTGLVNIGPEMNLESEINTDQESAQNSVEHKIGRGRGRLH